MGKKVLITGATGFIGRFVVGELLKNKYEVTAVTYGNSTETDERVNIIEGDICDESVIKQISDRMGNCDIFIHLAANLNIKGTDQTILTNVLGTSHCVKIAQNTGASCFIYMSSIPVIGVPKFLPVTEEHPAEPETLYHITKYTGEMIVKQAASDNMRAVILRIPSPIGCGMSPNNYLSFLLRKCINNEPIEVYGSGARVQNYIDVRDIASSVVQSIAADTGVYLIAGNQGISNMELALLCREITDSASEIICGKRQDPEEQNQWIISTDKARASFGFSPQYGLRETIQWIADNVEKSG